MSNEGDPNPEGYKEDVTVLGVADGAIQFSASGELLDYVREYGNRYRLKITPIGGHEHVGGHGSD